MAVVDASPVSTGSESAIRAVEHRRRRRSRQKWIVHGLQLLLVILILVAMQVVNHLRGDLVMPRPWAVVQQGWDLIKDNTMGRALWQTLQVFLIGYGISIVSGVVFGLLIGAFRTVNRTLDPFVNALNATPRIAFIPLIIVWLGLGMEAKIAVTWLSAFIPILLSTASGIEQADYDLSEMARSFGARGLALFWRVFLPSAAPSILTGLRIGSALAILGTIVSELYTAQAGLGGLMVLASNHFELAQYFSVVVVLMILGVIVSKILRFVEGHYFQWQSQKQEVN